MPAGHRARKRFSQNFLHDAHYIARIVEAIAPLPGQRVIEIGPGLGALTEALLQRTGSMQCVEIDRDLAARLRARFPPDQLDVIEADALEVDWPALARAAAAPLRIVGNLPYNISTPLLFALMPVADRVQDQHFMLQREVVERMVAPPGGKDYGRLSVTLQLRYGMGKLFDVPPGAFSPPPQVTSSVVRMRPLPATELPEVDFTTIARVVSAAFGQRRKTLRNALASVLDEASIRAAGIDPGARAETLPCEAFVALARAVRGRAESDQTGASGR